MVDLEDNTMKDKLNPPAKKPKKEKKQPQEKIKSVKLSNEQKRIMKEKQRYEKDKAKFDKEQAKYNDNTNKKENKKDIGKENKKKKISKKTLNLVAKEPSLITPLLFVILLFVILLSAGAISKFAVYDLYHAILIEENELMILKQQEESLDLIIKDMDETKIEYEKYSYKAFTDDELALENRLEILKMLEDVILPIAPIESCTINNYEAKITLQDISLEETTKMIQSIKAYPIVSSTSLHTANVIDVIPFDNEVQGNETVESKSKKRDSENLESESITSEENKKVQTLQVNLTITFLPNESIVRLEEEIEVEGVDEIAE